MAGDATGRGANRAVIDLAALRANHEEARRHAAGRELIAVVKADAYGHGAVPVARALVAAGCRRLAVVTVEEARELRDAGLEVPVLVLGGVHGDDDAQQMLAHRLTPVVHAEPERRLLAEAAQRAGRRLAVEVEVDTGMHRMGVPPEEAVDLLASVAGDGSLALAGTFTHLARADEPDLAPSLEQLARFRDVLRAARAAGVDPGAVHVANSAGLLAGEPLRAALDETVAARPGLMLYGARPGSELPGTLRPVMSLCTRVRLVRTLRAGEGVGYGATFRPEKDTRVATLPLGYADGVPVAASNRGAVCIGGRRFPMVGRVSMDSITVDVGRAEVAPGDEAVLFGRGPGGELPVEEAAAAAGTIAYELLVRVGARVPRHYVNDEV